MSASVNLPLYHKVQKFSSGTSSLRWSRKKGYRPLQPWTQHRTLTSLWTVISRCQCMSAPCVVQHFASCDSYVRSCDRCRLMWPRQVVVTLVAYCNLSSIRHFRHRAVVLTGVQNAAARLVTGTRRCDHITQVLQQLHWLPVRQRVEFKLAVLRSTTWRHHICGGVLTTTPL